MPTDPIPENDPLMKDAFQMFMDGKWAALGITGEQETALCARMRRYVSQTRTIPSHLLYAAKRVWDENKDRIVQEWADKIPADYGLYTDCGTCPNCDCPGMN